MDPSLTAKLDQEAAELRDIFETEEYRAVVAGHLEKLIPGLLEQIKKTGGDIPENCRCQVDINAIELFNVFRLARLKLYEIRG